MTKQLRAVVCIRFVRLLAGMIFWCGIVVTALILAATFAGLVWVLCQPGEIEAFFAAIGIVGIIMVCVVIWFWAYDYRRKLNAKAMAAAGEKPTTNEGD